MLVVSVNSGFRRAMFDLRRIEQTQLFLLGGRPVSVSEFVLLSAGVESLSVLQGALGLSNLGEDKITVYETLFFLSLRFDRFALFRAMLRECAVDVDVVHLVDVDGKGLMIYAAEYLTVSEDSCEACKLLWALGCDPKLADVGGYTVLHAAIHSLNSSLVRWCIEEQRVGIDSFLPAVKYEAALNSLRLLHPVDLSMLNVPVSALSWAIVGSDRLLIGLKVDSDISSAIELMNRLLEVMRLCGGLRLLKPYEWLLLLLVTACILERIMGTDLRVLTGSVESSESVGSGGDLEQLVVGLTQLMADDGQLPVERLRGLAVSLVGALDLLLAKPVLSSSVVFFLIAAGAANLLRFLITYKRSVVERCLVGHGVKILLATVCNGRVDVMNALLEIVGIGEHIDGYTAFMLASANGCISVVRDFLGKMKEFGDGFYTEVIDARDGSGRDAFMLAAMNDQVSVIQEFLMASGTGTEGNISNML